MRTRLSGITCQAAPDLTPCMPATPRRLPACPQLEHLPLYARLDMRVAYLDGDHDKAARILARPPQRTCPHCDLPGHALLQCAPATPCFGHLARLKRSCYGVSACLRLE